MKNNLRTIRKERGLTQAELAKLVGSTQPTIKRLETDESSLTPEWLERLSKALKVAPWDILSDGGAVVPASLPPIRQIPVLGVVPGGPMCEAIADDHPETIPFPTERDDLFALRVEGTSMNRIAPHGSFVVVDPLQSDPVRLHGRPIIAQNLGQVTFKKWDNNAKILLPDSTDGGHEPLRPFFGMEIKGEVIAVLNLLRRD